MTTITNLKLSPTVVESMWILNITDDSAIAGVPIVVAIPEYTHIIQSITISTNVPGKWIKILDGNNILVGPISLTKNTPVKIEFVEPVYCTAGNAVILQTEAVSEIHIIITGNTIPPKLEKATNPTPADNATGISLNPTLTWESSPQVISSDVYVNGVLSKTVSNSSCSLNTLALSSTYTWRVDDSDGNEKIVGETWTFTTEI